MPRPVIDWRSTASDGKISTRAALNRSALQRRRDEPTVSHALGRDASLEASSTVGRALVVVSTDYLLYLDGAWSNIHAMHRVLFEQAPMSGRNARWFWDP